MTTPAVKEKPALRPGMIEVLNPLGEAEPEQHQIAQRLDKLGGKTIGLLDNSKPNFDLFLDRVEELLRRDHQVGRVHRFRKSNAGVPVGEEVLKRVEGECDAVVNGSCD